MGPSEFLALAIETGLVAELDALVLNRACVDAAGWYRQLGERCPAVHVNVDGGTLLSGHLAEIVDQALSRSELPPEKLVLELSEPFLMANGDSTIDGIADIAKRGVKIAIDDVGTGATLLSRLGWFELDVLKIGGSLTNDVVASQTARQLIRSVVALGQALELSVAAESVEDASAIPVLRDLGVDVAQGHMFSAAIPAAKLEPLLTLRSTLARDDR